MARLVFGIVSLFWVDQSPDVEGRRVDVRYTFMKSWDGLMYVPGMYLAQKRRRTRRA